MLMSVPINHADQGARAGFTLMEILVVLVILAISTAIIMPSTTRMLDQATAHAVFFDFQKQVSDLRREANRTGMPIRLIERTEGAVPLEDDRTVSLRSPWRYTLAPALDIAAGGICTPASVNLLNGDAVVMTLRSDGPNCRFIRLQSAAGRLPASSSP